MHIARTARVALALALSALLGVSLVAPSAAAPAGAVPMVAAAPVVAGQTAGMLGEPVPLPPEPQGDEAPAGARDGEPVGSFDAPDITQPTARARVNSTASATAAVTPNPTVRYFGVGPWNAIKNAANNQPTCAGLTNTQLLAMIVTTIFRESGGATAAGREPAPMTLSRYDEWTGVYSTALNRDANYGLYAYRSPFTRYKQAFWHPGIGIWQYDSAGVGAPYTAAERMSVAFMAPIIARQMAGAYCSSKATTAAGKRYAAWYPWYLSCDSAPETSGGQVNPNAVYCEQIYQGLIQSNFSIVRLTSGIDQAGGVRTRSCRLHDGVVATCRLVDPSKAQGSSWWATMKPLDGGAPNRNTSPATPISLPFYVIKRDGQEIRYWLREDTGYDRDIVGYRTLGKNARPKSNQAGSGVTWQNGKGLCDLTVGKGWCDPSIPIPGTNSTAKNVTGEYTLLPLDANGDGRGDLYLRARPGATNRLWLGTGNGQFKTAGQPANDVGTPMVLDVNGDARDDVVYWDSTTGRLVVSMAASDGTFRNQAFTGGPVGATLHRLGRKNAPDRLLFYGAGSLPDAMWSWSGSTFSRQSLKIAGVFQPVIGDWDGNGVDDVVWYAPGTAKDYVWRFRADGTRLPTTAVRLVGRYNPVVGDFDGDGRDDILWYAPGRAKDSVWFTDSAGNVTSVPRPVSGHYTPIVVDLPNTGRDRVMWWVPGTGVSAWGEWSATRVYTSVRGIAATQTPVVGGFSTGGRDGIFWYRAGATPDYVWWQ